LLFLLAKNQSIRKFQFYKIKLMKHTPLTAKHIEIGAKMTDFAGYNMPISYRGLKEEHHNVRKEAGVFDV